MNLARLQPSQYDELAKLLHGSLDVWHRTRLNTDRFGTDWKPFRLTVDIYEELDPGCCVVATDDAGSLIEKADGSIAGFLAASALPTDNLIGQGVAEDEATMLELVRAMMDQHFRGQTVAFILPSRCSRLVQQAYAWGARNRETNLLSVLGDAPPIRGVTLPTFLPESG
jgi:hypothetical protein